MTWILSEEHKQNMILENISWKKLINNYVFGKTIEKVRKHRDIKLVTRDKRKNRLVLEPNYHIKRLFSENLLSIEMKKVKIKKIYIVSGIFNTGS